MSSVVRTPPPTVDVEERAAVFVACGNVQKAQFVRPRSIVSDGALDRIPSVAEIDEVDALHDAPVFDVETGNDSRFESHCADLAGRSARPPAWSRVSAARGSSRPS
jgi:hypothetical protein